MRLGRMYFRRNQSLTIPYWPLWVNEEIKNEILKFHPNPFAWWIGQLLNYVMRWQPSFEQELDQFENALGLKRPYIGYVWGNLCFWFDGNSETIWTQEFKWDVRTKAKKPISCHWQSICKKPMTCLNFIARFIRVLVMVVRSKRRFFWWLMTKTWSTKPSQSKIEAFQCWRFDQVFIFFQKFYGI